MGRRALVLALAALGGCGDNPDTFLIDEVPTENDVANYEAEVAANGATSAEPAVTKDGGERP